MRKMAWVIIVVNILFVLWIVAGVGGEDNYCDVPENRGVLTIEECEAARDVGTGIGVLAIGGCWFFVDFILLVLFLVTQPKEKVVIYAEQQPGQVTMSAPPPTTGPPMVAGPDIGAKGTVDANGYEWIEHDGKNYWRMAGSGSVWTQHQ